MNINTKTNIIQSTLDGAFDESTPQQEVFKHIEHFIPAVIQGFNCTIFAYGQTGSGNTFYNDMIYTAYLLRIINKIIRFECFMV